jgi:hypothetical protein
MLDDIVDSLMTKGTAGDSELPADAIDLAGDELDALWQWDNVMRFMAGETAGESDLEGVSEVDGGMECVTDHDPNHASVSPDSCLQTLFCSYFNCDEPGCQWFTADLKLLALQSNPCQAMSQRDGIPPMTP